MAGEDGWKFVKMKLEINVVLIEENEVTRREEKIWTTAWSSHLDGAWT